MNYKKIDFILVPLIPLLLNLFSSCGNYKSNDTIQQYVVETLLFPQDMDEGLQKFKNLKKTKIVAYIDGSCLPCLEDLIEWDVFLKNASSRNYTKPIKIFIYSMNSDFLKHVIIEETDFSMDLIYFDRSNSFFNLNNLSNDKDFHAFLIDSQNNIIFKGNPIKNEKFQEMYLK